jgi:SAM-dependent methyltransferase
MPTDHFGAEVAARYDQSHASMFDPAVVEPAVDFLAELADGGDVLEFGIGTGRIALPLARRGVRVHGIDLSAAMIAEMRAKPGAEQIDAAVGDFATTTLGRRFAVVYLVFNTIGNLTSQDEQVACFQNAAHHLQPGGCFVIEVGVPRLQRLAPGETFLAFDLSDRHIGVDEYDVVNQGLVSHHLSKVGDSFERSATPLRYVWPSELDLMARLADMKLRERWGSWERDPFTTHSTKHISVWQMPAADGR